MDVPVGGFADPQLSTIGREDVTTGAEILRRYRHLRAISIGHHRATLKLLARATLLQRARRLGLTAGQTLIAESEEQLTLIFDLAIYTAQEGRSRAIDRYADALAAPAGTDEVRMLAAMRQALFSVWQIKRLHETAGLVVTDVLRDSEVWLIDEGLERSSRIGMMFASRLCFTESFAITSGVIVPVTEDILDDVLMSALFRHCDDLAMAAQDPRFAAALYRAALDCGVMEYVSYA